MSALNRLVGPRPFTLLIIGAAFAYAASALAFDLDDELLMLHNEFEIGNGETKLIADHKTPETYRICVSKGPDTVPVKARYDSQEGVIKVGSCDNLTAKRIALTPAGRLGEDMVLIGKYERVQK
ncbi:hypothetical protein [Povalibacter sp.]|uniref:hypothetical protein n=1 Tax=Povalibacter sp. TaxID=1962978 RepID=UPI002F4027C5